MANFLFERHEGGERALLVTLQFPDTVDIDAEQNEFSLLAKSAGAEIIDSVIIKRSQPESKYFIGRGKVDEFAILRKAQEIDLVIFNHELTPAQERNLEKIFECRVLDRTGLILDIFASRARSHEGKLQVELAQLRHLSSRLIRGWSHLERQKGGIGLRGPGETQLESDRRMIGGRIKQIHKRLAKVSTTRSLGRKARQKAQLPTVSLVGYTNAGKSTLFNRLVHAKAYAADQLFATLDATLRRLEISAHLNVVLADTVGFVSRLPHTLVESFKSTLEETLEAELLLHVIDASSENYAEQRAEVLVVLAEIGAEEIPVIEVMNKIDALVDIEPHIDLDETGKPIRVWVSAIKGAGMALVLEAMEVFFTKNRCTGRVILDVHEGDIRATLFDKADIISEFFDENGNCTLTLTVERQILERCHLWDRFEST